MSRRAPLLLFFALAVAQPAGPAGCRRHGDPREDLSIGGRRQAGPDGQRHQLTGRASWYGKRFQGRRTACGEPFDMRGFTAAHKTLPFHTIVRVIDPTTRKSVVVRINDRGPYKRGRVIDLSRAAARDLGMLETGRAARRARGAPVGRRVALPMNDRTAGEAS